MMTFTSFVSIVNRSVEPFRLYISILRPVTSLRLSFLSWYQDSRSYVLKGKYRLDSRDCFDNLASPYCLNAFPRMVLRIILNSIGDVAS